MPLAQPPRSCKIYTSSLLADAMVAALGDKPHFLWLEPSHGNGAFLEALARRNVKKKRIVAIDLDRGPNVKDKLAKTTRGVDFLRWARQTVLRFDRIVGNPPFVAIGQLPPSLRHTAALVPDLSNRPIGIGANTWYAFVLASMRLLNRGGSIAFVLPASAEFADYSAGIRAALRDQFGRLEIYRSDRPLFAEVQEGSLVAIARDYQSKSFRVVRRRFPTATRLITELAQSKNINGRPCPSGSPDVSQSKVTFGSVARVQLGGVTGDARYFLMNEETRRRLNLPMAAFTPVVSRARHLRSAFIDAAGWEALKENGERVWLFNPSGSTADDPAVLKYLRRRIGGCDRDAFKVANRTPWYRTPLPPKPHAFLSGMTQVGPWLCINETRHVNATNTLYIVIFKNASDNERYGYALSFFTTSVRRQLRRLGRRYADGLIKYEPSALAGLRLPPLENRIDFRTAYVRALDLVMDGEIGQAVSFAESVVSPHAADTRS